MIGKILVRQQALLALEENLRTAGLERTGFPRQDGAPAFKPVFTALLSGVLQFL